MVHLVSDPRVEVLKHFTNKTISQEAGYLPKAIKTNYSTALGRYSARKQAINSLKTHLRGQTQLTWFSLLSKGFTH